MTNKTATTFTIRLCTLAGILAAAAMTAIALADPADAARGRRAGPPAGSYDGIWNVVFATTRGTCSSGYSVPFRVAGKRVLGAGGGRVHGQVSRAGNVAVTVSLGASHASGGGRLVGNRGTGAWSGIISGGSCGGTWQATRS